MRTLKRKIGLLAAGAAIAMTGSVLAPAAAYADTPCQSGEFCAYSDDCGTTAHWGGNSSQWGSCWLNKVDWVTNQGTPDTFDDVNIYWGSNNTGAYACLGRGDSWDLRTNQHRFTWGGGAGVNELVHDNAASHAWARDCPR